MRVEERYQGEGGSGREVSRRGREKEGERCQRDVREREGESDLVAGGSHERS